MRIIFASLFVIAAWKWSDWRNWQKYYPTIIFMMTVNFAASIVLTNHKLWRLTDVVLGTSHTVNNFLDSFMIFPSTVLLFLSSLPWQRRYQLIYIAGWVVIYGCLEYAVIFIGLITYENGWSIWWSVLFDCTMFPILAVHHEKPLVAWGLSLNLHSVFGDLNAS